MYGVVERTHSEFKAGALSKTRVSSYGSLPEDLKAGAIKAAFDSARGDYKDGTPRYFSCQTCHMRAVTGYGANKSGIPLRADLPLHDMTGGNYWMPDVILYQNDRGTLRLGGTTASVQPSGAFSLIRGRLDILGRRLTLSEASLALEGNFVPMVAVAASTQSDGITSFVRIDGPATEPVVSFTSTPQLPEEEVLARLLFGLGIENLSALQAAQLASAVATLAGRGGVGIINRLRTGFGLDDLDVQTDSDGAATVRAGKYLSENVYSEVQVDGQGQSQINLNLDLSPSVTVRGSAGSAGDTGLGIFFEKDY
jgi:hypothetical protein